MRKRGVAKADKAFEGGFRIGSRLAIGRVGDIGGLWYEIDRCGGHGEKRQ